MAKLTTKNIIKDVIIVAIGVGAILVALNVGLGANPFVGVSPFYVVSSGSMVPELLIDDVLVVNGNIPFSEIQVGDIIVFNKPNGHDRVIVHRVVQILDDNPKTIQTKGDANIISIDGVDYPITDEEYIGEVAFVAPQIGYVTKILSPPTNYIIIAVVIGIMIVKQYENKKEPKFGSEPPKISEKQDFAKQNDIEYSDSTTDENQDKTDTKG